MSKFIDKIHAQMTGRKKKVASPIDVSFDKINSPIKGSLSFSLVNEYIVGVEWNRKIACESKDLPAIIDNCVRELKEEIYGDIKNRINRLERNLYEKNYNKAMSEMRDIIREIF
jgi:hypothetical protein